MTDGSITHWFGPLERGDDAAVAAICDQYFDRLVAYARRRLQNVPTRVADEEDVALSALNCFAGKAAEGQFPDLQDRTELWNLLLTITFHKISEQKRRHHAAKRGAGKVRGESVFGKPQGDDAPGIENFSAGEPTPESIVELNERIEGMLENLQDKTLRTVATLRLQGYSVEEIAAKLPSTRRTVSRKLERIRKKWSRLLEEDNG